MISVIAERFNSRGKTTQLPTVSFNKTDQGLFLYIEGLSSSVKLFIPNGEWEKLLPELEK